MAEVVGTVSAIVGLVEFTASVGKTISRFLRAIGQVPVVISSINTHITNWQIHLDALQGHSKRWGMNQHLKSVLQDSGVLSNAQTCLERLNDIIKEATPSDPRQSRASEVWDQFAFRMKQSEVEELLQQMDRNTKHLQLALTTSTVESVEMLRREVVEAAMAAISAKDAGALFNWLEPEFHPRSTNPEQMQFEKSSQQEPDTCTWMTESSLWRDWLQGGSASVDGCRRLMWIYGLPGTGKTMLASFLIDYLLDRPFISQPGLGQSAKGFSYYYCHQEHDRDEALPFLRWVVRDLCKQLVPSTSTAKHVADLFSPRHQDDMDSQARYSSRRPDRSIPAQLYQMWQREQLSIDSLLECLQAVVGRFHSRHNKRVYIIVDAVDESKAPREKLLDVLTTVGTDPRFENVSLLMTSRQYQDVKGAIEDLPHMSLPMKSLVCRPSTTQQLSLSFSTAGTQSMEPVLDHGYHNHHEGPYSPKTPGPPSPDRRNYKSIIGRHAGEGLDLPTGSRGPSSDQKISPLEGFGRSTPSAADFCANKELRFSPTRKQSSPVKRSLMDDPVDTSPTRRRLRDMHVSPCTSLSMANPHVEKAIGVFVERRLKRCKRFQNWPRPAFLDEMKRTLAAKAGGIFRVVACHLDMIERFNLTEETQILECIRKMPDTIFETYEKILETLIPDGGDATREDREFARTALALMCSDTANIPDAEVLIAASRTTLPQLEAQFYTCKKLRKLLGCLVKIIPDPRPRSVFEREKEDSRCAPLYSVAHYTVKEFLYSEQAARGRASYFAISTCANQILELKIVFEGLRHFETSPRGTYKPTRYEEYCLEMTEKALSLRPAIIEEDGKLRDAVFACLRIDAPHRAWVTNRANSGVAKQHFPRWSALSPFDKVGGPSCQATSILVNLLLLEWPELARIYLTTLSSRKKEMVWRDQFSLSVQQSKCRPQRTLIHMCVSRRRLDFLKIFTAHGVHFQDSRDDVLFRALIDPYDTYDDRGGTTQGLLKELLEHGADPNPEGFVVTPLQIATHHLEWSWVHQLLSSDASVHAIGDSTGVDPFAPADDALDREWYRHKPLTICMNRRLDGKLTLGMQRGVEKIIKRYMNGEIIVLDS